MGKTALLLEEIDAMEKIQAEIAAISQRTDEARKHDLVQLRRELSVQIARVSTVGQDIFQGFGNPALALEFRSRFSAMRTAIALHQATWPAVRLGSADREFAYSAQTARKVKDAFINWTRIALKDLA